MHQVEERVKEQESFQSELQEFVLSAVTEVILLLQEFTRTNCYHGNTDNKVRNHRTNAPSANFRSFIFTTITPTHLKNSPDCLNRRLQFSLISISAQDPRCSFSELCTTMT